MKFFTKIAALALFVVAGSAQAQVPTIFANTSQVGNKAETLNYATNDVLFHGVDLYYNPNGGASSTRVCGLGFRGYTFEITSSGAAPAPEKFRIKNPVLIVDSGGFRQSSTITFNMNDNNFEGNVYFDKGLELSSDGILQVQLRGSVSKPASSETLITYIGVLWNNVIPCDTSVLVQQNTGQFSVFKTLVHQKVQITSEPVALRPRTRTKNDPLVSINITAQAADYGFICPKVSGVGIQPSSLRLVGRNVQLNPNANGCFTVNGGNSRFILTADTSELSDVAGSDLINVEFDNNPLPSFKFTNSTVWSVVGSEDIPKATTLMY